MVFEIYVHKHFHPIDMIIRYFYGNICLFVFTIIDTCTSTCKRVVITRFEMAKYSTLSVVV